MPNELDKKHSEKRKVLRVLGIFLLLLGIGFIAVGTADFFQANEFHEPTLFWCNFVGMPILFVGIVMSSAGFSGAVARYQAGEMAPVAKDTINYMVDGTKESVKGVVTAVKGKEHIYCPQCSMANLPSAKYCYECGFPLKKSCNKCGHENKEGAKFCEECGRQL